MTNIDESQSSFKNELMSLLNDYLGTIPFVISVKHNCDTT